MTATTKHIPGKRIKTWHHNWGRASGYASLLAFARHLIAGYLPTTKEHDTARRWLAGKGVRL